MLYQMNENQPMARKKYLSPGEFLGTIYEQEASPLFEKETFQAYRG